MKRRSIVWLGLWLCGAGLVAAYAQPAPRPVLNGYVYDAETGAPLPGANVFIANTLLGTATDDEGFFSLGGVPLGSHELVVSFLGYTSEARRVRLTEPDARTFTFHLEPMVVAAQPIEVTALSEKTRKKHFETFRKFFLGVSRNASRCEILNPEVLSFEVEGDVKDRLVVRARAPLQIENRALGYLLHFILDEFELRERQRYVRYRGRVGFTALTPRDEKERKAWEKRRREAYHGSFRHFLAALVRDQLWDEGFLLLSEEKAREAAYAGVPGSRPSARVSGVKPHEVLTPGELPFERRLDFPGYLKVIYFKEMPSAQYLKFRQFAARRMRTSEDEQVSYIALNHPGVVITTDGVVEDTYAVTRFGYWYFERVAELLPREYHPAGVDPMPVAATLDEAALAEAAEAGVTAARDERHDEAVRRLAPVLAAAPGYVWGTHGAAAYWLGVAYAAQGRTGAAHRAWRQGLDALAEQGRFEIRMADALVRSVFARQDQEAYTAAVRAYLTLLERAGQPLPEAEAAIVLRHVAQVLPVLTDEERRQVVDGRHGPLLQGLRLHPDAGAFLATWWRRQDPLPASPLNERVAEHLARVAYATTHFAFDGTPAGFDDRGTAYVRYGPPYTKQHILVDVSRATQVLRENAYPLPGTLVPPMNEFWSYRHIDDRLHYVFVLKGGRYQAGSPEDLVPPDLKSAHKRRGIGHTDPATLSNPSGEQAPANQVMAQALFELWKSLYGQMAVYHPDYEQQLEELTFQESDIRATEAGGPRTISATALSFVNGTQARFEALAREVARKREEEAPRVFTRIPGTLVPLPVVSRYARFLEADGSTRTELYWSHVPGSLALSKKLLKQHLPAEAPPPERYYVEMVLNVHDAAYRRQVPTDLRYLATDLPEGAPAPVQVATVTGTRTPYHLSVQWDQYLVEEGGGAVQPGAYLRTATARFEGLAPLNPDPAVLEMSDLKPVYLEEPGRPVAMHHADDPTAAVPFPFHTLRPEMPLGLEFEVYHLAFGDDERVHYSVEYEVVLDPEGRAEKRTSARSAYTGDATRAQEFIGLDLRSVDAGAVRVVVRVIDQVTGRVVERAVDFTMER